MSAEAQAPADSRSMSAVLEAGRHSAPAEHAFRCSGTSGHAAYARQAPGFRFNAAGADK